MALTERVHLTFRGRVQGVGFRWFVRELAQRMRVSGWVRNLPGGDVEAQAEAEPEVLRRFVSAVRGGPGYARVDEFEQRGVPAQDDREPFAIV